MSSFTLAGLDGVVWMDGRLVPWAEASLHVLSHGLNNASCVFEGERVFAGRVFKLAEHSARLVQSARILGMPLAYAAADLCAATEAVVAAQGVLDGYVRPIVWRGAEDIGIAAPHAKTHVAIAALTMGDVVSPEKRRAGVRLATSSWRRPAPDMAPVKAKASCHYVVGGLALRQAQSDGFDDALLLDHRGLVAEATGANVFVVERGVLRTPTTECIFDGITRNVVLELAERQGIAAVQESLHPDALLAADEIFLTGTACSVLPVSAIDDRELPQDRPVTAAIARAYAQLVGNA